MNHGVTDSAAKPVRIAINGYGRIGRSVLRALYESGARQQLQIVAINEPADCKTIAHLTKYDSTHGRFPGQVAVQNDVLTVNGDAIQVFHAEQISSLPWGDLGVDLVPTSYDVEPWKQQAGPTVFAPFAADTKYFGPDMKQQWMINFRVTDLDAMVDQLQAAGIEVQSNPDWDVPEIGRFARIHDPEGNPIELWEPASPA